MPRPARLLLWLLLLLTTGSGHAWADNPFGVMLWPNGGEDMSLLLARARGLGVAWYRPPAVFVDRWQPGAPCPACALYARSGFKLALTVRNSGRDIGTRQPSTPPADFAAYKATLASILDTWKPDLLVVENEESDPLLFADPDPRFLTYARELEAACSVAHARGVPCTNGGLGSTLAAMLTWRAFLERNAPDQACDFAKRAMASEAAPDLGEALCAYRRLDQVPPSMFGASQALSQIYRAAPIDLVNFHWNGRDARALAETADALSHLAERPAMSNEIGQARWHADQADIRPLLRAAFAASLKVAIWYSIDTSTSLSLFEPDGRLRPSGWEFQRQMSGRK